MEGRESRESPAVMPSHCVIIPTCNRAGWLPGAVRSALEQTVESLQVIVVDDGSTDDTPDVCRDLQRQDGRVRVCRQPNAGLAAARNTGLQAAEGRWAAFLDDDDLLHPQALARLSAAAGDALAAVSWAQTFHSGRRDLTAAEALAAPDEYALRPWGEQKPREHLDVVELVLRPLVPINAAVFDAARLREVGGFRSDLREAEDYDLWLRLCADAPVPVVHEFLALVRTHPEQMSGSLLRMARTTRSVLERFLAECPEVEARVPARALRHRLAHLAREEAYAALLAGQSADAARASWDAIRRRPLHWKSWLYLGFSPVPGAYRALRALKA